ncbi:P1 family peptidase [Cytobacillus oceanisediminis]|uniref:DmpA family aminopeptidase n=1 Tax=Cytobacillus TaxID=2675230 RepID=UPI00203A753C|nr:MULTISPECIES: P1 family peptidase [Cytobacillus]MBY0156319.1 P1 family peptidase [Cytobacillus firmus]MCM3392431.1 P1 family peptidase [Cytobacillus oceanisediminis]MCM3530813.1 P1 family peptidase [Cytobacillus oceanisediminis]UQX55501.1 P1 family peptidase [Cytobacillus pseudoceanisediminis]
MKIRERGVTIGKLQPGKKNCITDVEGVMVGQITLDYPLNDNDQYVCTGVTAVLPHGRNLFREKVPAASYVINGFGKTTGLVQVEELGMIESPIMLTNTFGVPAVTHGTLKHMLRTTPEIGDTTGTVNIVVGECNDGYLNSIRALPVKPEHAIAAIENANSERAEEGAVGAGKGMVCFGYKGGVGASSRVISEEQSSKDYIIGCLVVTNFGNKDEFPFRKYGLSEIPQETKETPDGSIMIILATDAPVSDRQLKRLAKRCGIGLGRTGSHYSNGSGDIVIAFSTARTISHQSTEHVEFAHLIRDDHPLMNKLFQGAAESAEEAILNSLSQAETTKGRQERVVEGMFS